MNACKSRSIVLAGERSKVRPRTLQAQGHPAHNHEGYRIIPIDGKEFLVSDIFSIEKDLDSWRKAILQVRV